MIGYVLGATAPAGLMWAAYDCEPPRSFNFLVLIGGGLLGWIVGMLMTPISTEEKKQFPAYGTALSTFVSGYLLAKLEKLFEQQPVTAFNLTFYTRFGIAVVAFFLGIVYVYVWRVYVRP